MLLWDLVAPVFVERPSELGPILRALIVCDERALAVSLQRRLEGAASVPVATSVVDSSAGAIAELVARDCSDVVVAVESSDRARLVELGEYVAAHRVLALLTFGRDPGTGDFIDPWNVGAHGHFAADDLTASNLLRAVAYARSRADRGQAETGLFPVSNSEAPSKAAWSAPQASRRLVLDAVKFQASLLAAAGQAIVAHDPSNTVVYWNAAAQATYGWSAEEAVGADIGVLLPVVAGWEERHVEVVQRARSGQNWSGELCVHAKGGAHVPVLVANTALRDDAGELLATITVSSDISERLRSEAAAARMSALVESSSEAIFSTDLDGNVTTWNPAAARLFGYTSGEIIGQHVRILMPPDMLPDLGPALARVIAGHTVAEAATLARRADSTLVELSTSMSPLRDRFGAVIGVSMIGRDITERIEYERRITADRRRLEEAQASAGFGSFEIDLVANSLTRSDEFWRIIGRTPDDQEGQDFSFVHPDDLHEVEEALGRVLDGQSAVDCTHRVVRPNGEVRWVITRTSKFRDPSDLVIAGTMLDITDRREAELATEHLVFHDPLTGLPNRARITDRLDFQLTARNTGDGRIAVALLDLDQFKVVNDSLGHAAGDSVLLEVARRIETVLKTDEVLARFGGDEFAVVAMGVADLSECDELGSRLLASLDEPVTVDRRDFHLSLSVGITLNEPGDSADSMFREADIAMYHAKESGRARMAMYDESLQAASRRRLDLRAALQTALDLDELSIVYQPVIDLQRCEPAGSRRSSAGPARPSAPSAPQSSSRSPRRQDSSVPSASGCSTRHSRRSPNGDEAIRAISERGWRSTSRPARSRTSTW
ncbi:PAS domain S-box protein [Aquihabitans sp. G128]|nr:PAS domain S-box protein [Aquihabitans sp. G128]